MVLSREKIANIFVNFLIFKKRKNALFMIWLINTVYLHMTWLIYKVILIKNKDYAYQF